MEDGGLLQEEQSETRRVYQFSLWWVNHRAKLWRMVLGLFIAFDATLFLYGGWHLLDAFAISYGSDQLAVAEMVAFGQGDLHAYTVANAAVELKTGEELIFSAGGGRYDLYSTITNPNYDWWAEFTYHFDTGTGNEDVELYEGFILPGETKPVVEISVNSGAPISDVSLIIDTIRWHRVDHHLISDYQQWSMDRLSIIAEDAEFTKETRFDDQVFGRTSFTVSNYSVYSYYKPVLYVLLKKGDSVVGVNKTTMNDLENGTSEDIVLNWFGFLPSVSDVEVIVELQLFDVDTYKALGGGNTRDTRTRAF
ncbi:MAG: hypothetical protein HQ488_00870 [Parcubacteria group bacterium]|nr:hypothetical protein [Parcubacteria group bacterium]